MIRVQVVSKKDDINTIIIKGHANSKKGDEFDMVCAEVSAISVGALNAIHEMLTDSCDLEMDSGYVKINVRENSNTLQTMLNMLMFQLKSVEYVNSKHITIEKVEV